MARPIPRPRLLTLAPEPVPTPFGIPEYHIAVYEERVTLGQHWQAPGDVFVEAHADGGTVIANDPLNTGDHEKFTCDFLWKNRPRTVLDVDDDGPVALTPKLAAQFDAVARKYLMSPKEAAHGRLPGHAPTETIAKSAGRAA